MGLSFDDEPSLVEAVAGGLRFRAADSNPISRTGSPISQDGVLSIGPQDVDAILDVEMISVREKKSDDDIGGSDDIQMIDE
jgi:hypothetical protein